jgi:hypothetical protein
VLLLDSLGLRSTFGPAPASAAAAIDPAASSLTAHALTVSVPTDFEVLDSAARGGITVTLSPRSRGDLGFVIAPFGELSFTQTNGPWKVTTEATPGIEAFTIGPRGFLLRATPGTTRLSGRAEVTAVPDSVGEPALVIGPRSGSRVEVDGLTVSATTSLAADQTDVELMLDLSKVTVVIAAGEGDGFLQQVLPRDGVRVVFDVGLGWSNRNGFSFRGAGGLEVTFPVSVEFAGVRIEQIALRLRADSNGVDGTAAATLTTQLGPVKAGVEGFGLRAALTFPHSVGNLGVADLALAFLPPRGVALAIDAGVIVGGGYLQFDPDRDQYAGSLQLELAETIAVTAIGLLTTRLPDGSPGFSLLIILTAEGFAPIQLGFGFTLTGIGGLIGVNRTTAVDALRDGIRTGALNSVLFPADPVRNVQRIVTDLGTIFLPQCSRSMATQRRWLVRSATGRTSSRVSTSRTVRARAFARVP